MTELQAADGGADIRAPGSVTVERQIAAAPAVVYRYLTESEKWALWQGVAAELHPKPGGSFLMSMPNGLQASGRFVELIPDERVTFTWGWMEHPDVPPGSTTVLIDLIPRDGGTLVRLTHSGLPEAEVEIHARGWHHYLPRLGHVASGGEPAPDPGPA